MWQIRLVAASAWLVMGLLAGCSAGGVGGLAIASADVRASAICSPGGRHVEARFLRDQLTNFTNDTITLTGVELDEHARDIELISAGFMRLPTDGPSGDVGPYEGEIVGAGEIQVAPGEVIVIEAVLRGTRPDVIAVTSGLVVRGARSDGRPVVAHTCWALAVAPSSLQCNKDDGSEAFDPRSDYLDDVCTRPT